MHELFYCVINEAILFGSLHVVVNLHQRSPRSFDMGLFNGQDLYLIAFFGQSLSLTLQSSPYGKILFFVRWHWPTTLLFW